MPMSRKAGPNPERLPNDIQVQAMTREIQQHKQMDTKIGNAGLRFKGKWETIFIHMARQSQCENKYSRILVKTEEKKINEKNHINTYYIARCGGFGT